MKLAKISLVFFAMHTFGCQTRQASGDAEIKSRRQPAGAPTNAPILQKSYPLDRSILENKNEKSTVSSYLAMGVNYDSVAALFTILKKDSGVSLKNRGEAHITVLTPSEFGGLGRPGSKGQLEAIIREANLQETDFTPVCLGRGTAKGGKVTYFIVVDSPALFTLRQKIKEEFDLPFDANHYYPHITVGFSDGDLHEQNGVIKDKDSCVAELVVD